MTASLSPVPTTERQARAGSRKARRSSRLADLTVVPGSGASCTPTKGGRETAAFRPSSPPPDVELGKRGDLRQSQGRRTPLACASAS